MTECYEPDDVPMADAARADTIQAMLAILKLSFPRTLLVLAIIGEGNACAQV